MSPQHRASPRLLLSILVMAWGIQAIVTQSILLREALVLMLGTEFAWGIVLFAWLLGVAVGALLGGRLSERLRQPEVGLVLVLLVLSVAACVDLWVFRGARAWLGVGVGELLPLPKTAAAAMLFISPVSALVGASFPLACRATTQGPEPVATPSTAPTNDPLLQFGDVYALESAGGLIGGAAFSFWAVEHASPIQITLSCATITTAAAALLLVDRGRRNLGRGLFLLGFVALGASVLLGGFLNEKLVARRWQQIAPDCVLCAEAESRYQNLAVTRRRAQYTLYSDGQVTTDFPDPYTFVPWTHLWLCQHPQPRGVLMLGGGAEGMLAEILRHPIEQVTYVEPDPMVIDLIKPFVTDEDRLAVKDQRVIVHHGDARHFIKTQSNRFDLVLVRVPEPMSALHARFYTAEFYGELRRAMTARSVLCLTAAAAPGELPTASASYLGSLVTSIKSHFPQVTVTWGDPAHIFAATEGDLVSIDPAELVERFHDRSVQSDLFDPLWFEGATDWLDPTKIEQRAVALQSVPDVAISTDLHPYIYLQRLALWERMVGGKSASVMEHLSRVGLSQTIVVLVFIGLITVGGYKLRASRRSTAESAANEERPVMPRLLGSPGHGSLPADPFRPPLANGACPLGAVERAWFARSILALSVGSTGLVTMALSIIWLFTFQNLYGYVYQRIGWIIALFMAGLVAGSGGISRGVLRSESASQLPAKCWRLLILVDVCLALLAGSIPLVLPALGAMPISEWTLLLTEICICALVLVTGVLGGATFALAGAVELRAIGRPGAAAATVVGADHVGACIGALLSGILLVPVYGTIVAALLLGAVKLSSASLLALARGRVRGV